jgi:cell division protein FtsB
MKNLLTLCLFIAVLCLAWQYREASEREAAAQASISELKEEIAQLRADAHGTQQPGKPGAKTNWIDEKNRNYQSSLTAGATGGKGHQPPPSPTPPSKLIGR